MEAAFFADSARRAAIVLACATLGVLIPTIASAKDKWVIGKDVKVLDADINFVFFGKTVYLDDVGPEDPGHDMGMVEELSGIAPTPFAVRRSIGLRNGFATIKEDRRWIVYDPAWYGGSDYSGSRYLLMGHEIGHHMCGHVGLERTVANSWQRELEADRYAGSVIRRLTYLSIQRELEQQHRVWSDYPSDSHPPFSMRAAAVTEGYDNGSPCQTAGFIKPRVFSPQEQAQIASVVRGACMEMVRDACSKRPSTDLRTLLSRMSLDCEIPQPPMTGPFAVVGMDCVGGGRFTMGKFKQ
jgi:hypothetical protein